jgi:hypothetical protein
MNGFKENTIDQKILLLLLFSTVSLTVYRQLLKDKLQ